jgi:hypothetical protein
MRPKAILNVMIAIAGLIGSSAYAANFVRITDASLLKYQTDPSGKIFLRNLNSFDTNALGCCYNYYIDTLTVEGKLIWTTILSLSAQGKGLWIRVPDNFAPGPISQSGEW